METILERTISKKDARQAEKRPEDKRILSISTIGASVALVSVLLYFYAF